MKAEDLVSTHATVMTSCGGLDSAVILSSFFSFHEAIQDVAIHVGGVLRTELGVDRISEVMMNITF